MLQTALRQRYSQLPACNGSMCLRRLERSDPGLPRMPTTVVGLGSRQRCSPRAGSRRLLLITGHADTTSPKQGASSINCERDLQYRVRGAPVPTTRNRGTNYSESTSLVPMSWGWAGHGGFRGIAPISKADFIRNEPHPNEADTGTITECNLSRYRILTEALPDSHDTATK